MTTQDAPTDPSTPTGRATLTLRAAKEHDAIVRATRRRDGAILDMARGGMTAPDIARGIGGRLTAERIRQICRAEGVDLVSKPGRKRISQ